LISPWIAEGANSDVYAILKSDIVEMEELVTMKEAKKRIRRRRK